jgi:hypothetical protein
VLTLAPCVPQHSWCKELPTCAHCGGAVRADGDCRKLNAEEAAALLAELRAVGEPVEASAHAHMRVVKSLLEERLAEQADQNDDGEDDDGDGSGLDEEARARLPRCASGISACAAVLARVIPSASVKLLLLGLHASLRETASATRPGESHRARHGEKRQVAK